MNKIILIGQSLTCLFLSTLLFLSCNNASTEKNQQVSAEGYSKFAEENPIRKDVVDSADELTGNYFKSYRYKFSINLINNWIVQKGDKNFPIVVQCYQQDSGKSIGVFIYDYPSINFDKGNSSANQLEQLKELVTQTMAKNGIEPLNLNFSKSYLGNVEAIVATCNVMVKASGQEIEYFKKQIQCFNNGKLYNVTVSYPSVFYTSTEANRTDAVIKSFKFQ